MKFSTTHNTEPVELEYDEKDASDMEYVYQCTVWFQGVDVSTLIGKSYQSLLMECEAHWRNYLAVEAACASYDRAEARFNELMGAV